MRGHNTDDLCGEQGQNVLSLFYQMACDPGKEMRKWAGRARGRGFFPFPAVGLESRPYPVFPKLTEGPKWLTSLGHRPVSAQFSAREESESIAACARKRYSSIWFLPAFRGTRMGAPLMQMARDH